MARIEDLINDISDTKLRQAIASEVAKLKAKKKFGLVFEQHLPEVVQLPGLAVKPGAHVAKRRDKAAGLFLVKAAVNGTNVSIVPDRGGAETVAAKDDLIVVKRFGEPMYPALIPVDRVTREEGRPYHTLINADNFHALQVLLYCYEAQVDVIYIDPPYNTGARDWKYNNNYVDKTDQYRHSKWLSMMKKRLELARRLLKPNGIMVIAIDDYEAHHLRCLIEDTFDRNAFLGCVVVRSKPSGNQTEKGLSVSHEYALFVGSKATVEMAVLQRSEKQRARFDEEDDIGPFWWENLRRAGSNSRRKDRPRLYYPIWVTKDGMLKIPQMEWHEHKKSWMVLDKLPESAIEVFPVRDDGSERNWSWSHTKVASSLGDVKAERSGLEFAIFRKRRMRRPGVMPQTIWYDKRFSASEQGTNLLRNILGAGEKFSYPKSLYTVAECIRCASENQDALIVDFFGGSGTTLHATALLNAEDGGRRTCILVTNNEVGEKTAKELIARGIEPGTTEWEREGIAESVAWPRVRYCLEGKRADGSSLPGEYLDGRLLSDGFEENAQYLKLDFLDPADVKRGETYTAILPILWLMAGASGDLGLSKGSGSYHFPKDCPFCVLIREDHFKDFAAKLVERPDVTHVFLVTDSVEAFHEMVSQVGKGKRCIQLYKSYLDNFKINLEPKNAD